MAYVVEKRMSKTPEKFGQGAIEGVAAPESANNAYANAAMIPLLTLGIPSSPTIAVLMGAFIINGLTPGPFLFKERPDLVWAVIASFMIGNVILLILNLPLVGLWARLLRLPYQYVCVGTLLFCIIGAYSLQQSVFDVGVMIVCGVIGYGLRKIDLPTRAFRARPDPRPVHREIAAHLARNVGWRLLDLLHAAAVPRAAVAGRLAVLVGSLLRLPPPRGARIESLNAQPAGRRNVMHVSHRHCASRWRRLWRSPPRPALPAPSRTSPTSRSSSWSPIRPAAATDIAARIVAAIAEKSLGQPIVVVNKGGAGGQVGWTEMVRQKPDGYYIGFINLPATNTVILDPDRKAIFTEKDFTPIINQVLDPGVIWVGRTAPTRPLQDLIDAAKKSPNTIRAATTGILSDDHLAILMAEEAAPGAIFRIVHLEGGAAQFKEIMAGNIDVAFDNVGSIARARAVGRGARARGDGRRALEIPPRRADHEGARLSDRHVELHPRHRRTEGHARAGRGQAARGLEEGDGRSRSRQQAREPGSCHQGHGGRRNTQSISPTPTPRRGNTPSGRRSRPHR